MWEAFQLAHYSRNWPKQAPFVLQQEWGQLAVTEHLLGTTSPLNIAPLSASGNPSGLLQNPADEQDSLLWRRLGTIKTKTTLATMAEKPCYKGWEALVEGLQMKALGEREGAPFTFCTSVTYWATIKGENTVNSSARAAMWLYILSTRRAHSRTTDRSSVLPKGAKVCQTH